MFVIIIWVVYYFSSVLSSLNSGNQEIAKPVVMWHGMNDYCCNPHSLGWVKKLIENEISGVYVLSLMIGNNISEDKDNAIYMKINDQVDMACKKIASNPKLTLGYNAIGFSQGAQFLRAVAQRCPTPRMYNLISLGGQHQGVCDLPNCLDRTCRYIRKLVNTGVYWKWVQNNIVQAQYWHDPKDEKKYRKKSIFLAEINNEYFQNNIYKQNLLQLENFVLVKFDDDQTVKPVETSWFEFYTPGQAVKITPLRESPLYIEDRLGLRELDQSGRLHFLSSPGEHLSFTYDWFIENIIDKYLRK